MGTPIPILYVEGKDDISVINALLGRHGVDTERGKRHLCIKDQESVEQLLASMGDAIKTATDKRIGFVVDIDIAISQRWQAVKARMNEIGMNLPDQCPANGFIGKLDEYPHNFGIWLMPDCATDGQMLEHLVETLLPANDPLWPHAKQCTARAVELLDDANQQIPDGGRKWKRFGDQEKIKAEVHSWLAWQREPGVALGAAINDHILSHDSPQAIAFLKWAKELFGLTELNV